MNAERLLLLADFLETKVPKVNWYYGLIYGREFVRSTRDVVSCGSTACAVGWAAFVPELKDEIDVFKPWETAQSAFGLSYAEMLYLFQPCPNDDQCSPLGPNATAAEVASHIRSFVASGGLPAKMLEDDE